MIEAKHTKEVYNCYKKHHHDTLAIATIKQGKIHIAYEQKEVFLTPNSLAIFNPYENHKTTVINEDTSDYYILYFGLSSCLNLQKNEVFNPLNQHIIEDVSLHKSFFSLFHSQDEKEAELFLTTLFNRYCDAPTINKKSHEVLEKIKTIINGSDYETLTLESLAAQAHVSQNHLIRIFKKEFGSSPHAYILNHKIHKAKRLLEQGHTIAKASVDAGFYDQSHFHKAFKSVFAITPKEFQKRLIFYKTNS